MAEDILPMGSVNEFFGGFFFAYVLFIFAFAFLIIQTLLFWFSPHWWGSDSVAVCNAWWPDGVKPRHGATMFYTAEGEAMTFDSIGAKPQQHSAVENKALHCSRASSRGAES